MNTYYELQLKINPNISDIVSEICFPSVLAAGYGSAVSLVPEGLGRSGAPVRAGLLHGGGRALFLLCEPPDVETGLCCGGSGDADP